MNYQDIFIQILGFVPSMIVLTSLQSNNRKRILLLQLLCSLMWGAHYLLLGASTAVIINGIGMLRASVCYFNDHKWASHKSIPVILIALYALGTAATWENAYSLLPCFSMMLTTVALWNHNMKLTRLLFLLNSPPMFAYDIAVGSYSCAVVEVLAFASFCLAIYRFDFAKKNPAAKEPA